MFFFNSSSFPFLSEKQNGSSAFHAKIKLTTFVFKSMETVNKESSSSEFLCEVWNKLNESSDDDISTESNSDDEF